MLGARLGLRDSPSVGAMPLDDFKDLSKIQDAAPATDARRWHMPNAADLAHVRGDALLMGIFWVTLATALFAGLAGFARAAIVAGLPPTEVAFLRNLCALGFLTPMILRRGRELFATENLKLYGLRCTVSTISMTAWFCAIGMIPLYGAVVWHVGGYCDPRRGCPRAALVGHVGRFCRCHDHPTARFVCDGLGTGLRVAICHARWVPCDYGEAADNQG
jgi:hypothetical protein